MFATYRKAVMAGLLTGAGVVLATVVTTLQGGGGLTKETVGAAIGAGLVAGAGAGKAVYETENAKARRG